MNRKWTTYCDGGLVHRAARAREEDVHDNGHCERTNVHANRGANKQRLPRVGLGGLDFLQAVLGPCVCEINEQDKSDKEEEDGADKSDIVAPDGEEGVGNQESDDDEANPCDQLGTPEAVLDSRSLVSGVADSDEEKSEDKVEETESEVDAVDGSESITLLAGARDGGIVQQYFLQLLDGPIGEHDPGQQRVEEEDDGVGNACGHAVVAFAACAAESRACCRSAAGSSRGDDGAYTGHCQKGDGK